MIAITDLATCWKPHKKKLLELEAQMGKDAWDEESLVAAFNNSVRIIAAFYDGVLVGYAATEFKDHHTHYIWNIVVDENYRKQSIGYLILKHLLHVSSKRNIFLHVRESNKAARHLYTKLGFNETSRESNHYDDGELALIMNKER